MPMSAPTSQPTSRRRPMHGISTSAPYHVTTAAQCGAGKCTMAPGIAAAAHTTARKATRINQTASKQSPPTMLLSDDAAKPVLVANLDAATGAVRIKAVDLAPPAADKSFELWLVPPDGTAPRSLGVIEGQSYETDLGAADFADLRKGALAVSLEPAGGSPTGQVTGPVLYVGPVLPVS